jgi:voltage-gated potassium channel
MGSTSQEARNNDDHDRLRALRRFERLIEGPIAFLGFVWLLLFSVELIDGPGPVRNTVLAVIWVIFAVDFALRLVLAPHKALFMRSNVLSAISLLLPPLRIFRAVTAFRALRFLRFARGLRLVRVVTSVNRGMASTRRLLRRRGLGYVVLTTLVVAFVGAAAIYRFERASPEAAGFESYADALYWTAMMLTTSGSGHWPATAEGKALCFMLALYAFTVFSYITASLATFFIGKDASPRR